MRDQFDVDMHEKHECRLSIFSEDFENSDSQMEWPLIERGGDGSSIGANLGQNGFRREIVQWWRIVQKYVTPRCIHMYWMSCLLISCFASLPLKAHFSGTVACLRRKILSAKSCHEASSIVIGNSTPRVKARNSFLLAMFVSFTTNGWLEKSRPEIRKALMISIEIKWSRHAKKLYNPKIIPNFLTEYRKSKNDPFSLSQSARNKITKNN